MSVVNPVSEMCVVEKATNTRQLYNIMEEKKNAFINASAHCGTMDGSDARCQRFFAKSVQQT
ncbi:hypothetical protein T06_10324 [Trichinella sp. T6]|nr:hypothetical protein T06_10324 [Trichinella sp. T6]